MNLLEGVKMNPFDYSKVYCHIVFQDNDMKRKLNDKIINQRHKLNKYEISLGIYFWARLHNPIKQKIEKL